MVVRGRNPNEIHLNKKDILLFKVQDVDLALETEASQESSNAGTLPSSLSSSPDLFTHFSGGWAGSHGRELAIEVGETLISCCWLNCVSQKDVLKSFCSYLSV